jgi:hypothetical protein
MASGSHPSTWATYVSATHRLRQQLRRANGLTPMVHRSWYRCTLSKNHSFSRTLSLFFLASNFSTKINSLLIELLTNLYRENVLLRIYAFSLALCSPHYGLPLVWNPHPGTSWHRHDSTLEPSTPMGLLPLKWNPGTSSHWNGLVIFGTPWLGLLS